MMETGSGKAYEEAVNKDSWMIQSGRKYCIKIAFRLPYGAPKEPTDGQRSFLQAEFGLSVGEASAILREAFTTKEQVDIPQTSATKEVIWEKLPKHGENQLKSLKEDISVAELFIHSDVVSA